MSPAAVLMAGAGLALAASVISLPSGAAAAVEPDETAAELRTDGPTLEEYVAAGYSAENYPPTGYAERAAEDSPIAKLVAAALAPKPPKYVEVPGHLGPTAVNGT
jgi:hypothetical protein